MWNRIDLKERGKAAFRKNYWMCVIVALVLALTAGSAVSNSNNSDDSGYTAKYEYYDNYTDHGFHFDIGNIVSSVAGIVIGAVVGIFAIVMVLLNIFVFRPIEIGGCRFFIENAYENPTPAKLLFAFKSGYYGKMVLTMFLKNLYTALWTLLFVIPGIVKSYEYRMIPYLMADCPEMPREEAFAISKEMMDGNKMEAFILDLSFIGWNLLTAISCGLVGLFWTNPYQNATNAELFLELKNQYFAKRNAETIVY